MDKIENIYRAVAAGRLTKADALVQLRALEAAPVDDGGVKHSSLEAALVSLYGDCARLPAENIDPEEPLENYGIDSIIITEMNRRLGAYFRGLSKTLFFEHRTLASLATFLAQNKPEGCASFIGTPMRTAKKVSPRNAEPANFTRPKAGLEASPIAIIGLSGRYPLADNLAVFWQNLSQGRDCISEVPAERWPLDGFYEPDPDKAAASGRSYGKWGGFIDGYADFDPLFFNIAPIEANNMDPQERLFLMAAWHALEDAGITRKTIAEQYRGRVGVYAGVTRTGFSLVGAEAAASSGAPYQQPAFSSIPNRVSYFLDLNGPSLPVDTMCSSSLTAVHEACAALQRGDCDMALAGGVNLCVHPSSFTGLSNGRMLSTDGRCRSFGAGGDGYVPGEGVGVVLLKPLAAAQRDGDLIRAVIRASSVNHGGKTNGFTVPNPLAQADLIRENLRKANVDARSVSYVEAHGTGTELGDPIEISGLTQAFSDWTEETGFCAIGSAKSNIGHLEAAAGIAGLTKVLLQMEHRKLVPSLHTTDLNPNIDFDDTPFIVQRRLDDWKCPQPEQSGETTDIPRIATVSSFGAGGSNAHLVLEEYAVSEPEQEETVPMPFLLSARTVEQLPSMAEALLNYLEPGGGNDDLLRWAQKNLAQLVGVDADEIDPDSPLEDLGTETFHRTRLLERLEETFAISVPHGEFLKKETLRDIVDGLPGKQSGIRLIDFSHTLQVGREAMDARTGFVASSLAEVVDTLRAVSNGTFLESVKSGSAKKGRKLLADQDDRAERETQALKSRDLETLLDLWVLGHPVAWHKLATGQSPRRISLPGYPFAKIRCWPNVAVRSVEKPAHPMAQRIAPKGMASHFTGKEPFLTDHVINGAPVLPGVAYLEMARVATKATTLRNVIWAKPIIVNDDGINVEIALISHEERKVNFEITSDFGTHCQGIGLTDMPVPVPALDLEAIKARQSRARFAANEIYDAYDAMGISYGRSHRGIEEILAGDGELLAKLRLPDTAEIAPYILHPSLMDAAFQATLGLALGKQSTGGAMLPFALESLCIYAPTRPQMWAFIRETNNSGKMQKADIDLCDDAGNVCVRMTGFSSKALAPAKPEYGLLLSAPVWKESQTPVGETPDRQIFLLGMGVELPGAENLRTTRTDAGEACRDLLEQLFARVKSILEAKPANPVLVQVAVQDALLSSASGLLKSASLESRNLLGQVVLFEGDESEDALRTCLDQNAAAPSDIEVRYINGCRQVRSLEEVVSDSLEIPWKDEGVYLLSGGAGELGLLFAEEIARHCVGTTIVLTGRSDLTDDGKRRQAKISANVLYKQVDVTDAAAVQDLVQGIVREQGKLSGVLHIAGVLRDSFLLKKDTADFRQVLAPKIQGAICLDQATRDLDLDLFVMFSSGAALFGNLGQTDYAAANAFLDAFATQRGKGALSVNWPLWAEGGMAMDAATRDMMLTTTGIAAMASKSGFEALYRALSLGLPQVAVAEGIVARMREKLLARPKAPAPQKEPSIEGDAPLLEAAEAHLQGIVSELLQLDIAQIDIEDNLGDYGFDSIAFTKFANRINTSFKLELIPTIFFDFPEIASIAEHLLAEHPNALRAALNVIPAASAPPRQPVKIPETAALPKVPQQKRGVAIVGLAGRFPGARDINTFWELLESGTDAISEVPKTRWDWRRSVSDEESDEVKRRVKWGGFIDGVDEFDPLFFGISPREAELMDPQQRLMMMYIWAAIEDAGYAPSSLAGSDTGLYVATAVGNYGGLIARAGLAQDAYSSTS
ncbi:MAG: SDR family NAD(P)-dependent oxidoreductase [Rhodospirillaceae bacterium]|nr:SDR family NAD(P)-dependent oxidoreductase [Rhodospirillaceae bacterium]